MSHVKLIVQNNILLKMTSNSPRLFLALNKQISCLILPTTLNPVCLLLLNVVLVSVKTIQVSHSPENKVYVMMCKVFPGEGQ